MGDRDRIPRVCPLLSALTWALVSMFLLVDLAFRALVMLSGRRPNLQDKMKNFSGMNRKLGGPHTSSGSSPDLTRRQRQYVMGFLRVECAAPGGERILCSSDQSEQNLTDRKWGTGTGRACPCPIKKRKSLLLFLTVLLGNVPCSMFTL